VFDFPSAPNDTGIAERDLGIDRAASAEARQPELSLGSFAAIVRIAKRQATVHVDDVLRECHVRPKHFNAWGAVWMRAIRTQIIEHTGELRPCRTDGGKHRHNYPVYRSLGSIDRDYLRLKAIGGALRKQRIDMVAAEERRAGAEGGRAGTRRVLVDAFGGWDRGY